MCTVVHPSSSFFPLECVGTMFLWVFEGVFLPHVLRLFILRASYHTHHGDKLSTLPQKGSVFQAWWLHGLQGGTIALSWSITKIR